MKYGLLRAKQYVGELVIVKIGIPPEASLYAGPGDVIFEVPAKPKDAHKGVGGKVLVIGGSEHYTGAPALSAMAALKAGADLVFVAAPESAAPIISSYSPNLIVRKVPGKNLNVKCLNTIEELLGKVGAIVLGPGIGLFEETKETIKNLIPLIVKSGKPVVIDADALKIIAEQSSMDFKGKAILTPHAKEASILLRRNYNMASLYDRSKVAKELSAKYNAVILLKGPTDIIAFKNMIKFNRTGNQGMSVGGTGDTLTGIIATLLARKVEPFKAAYIGAFINGLAGDLAYKELGERLTATDVLDNIPLALKKPLESYIETRKFFHEFF